MVFLRKIQQIPGTDPRYPKIQIWQDFLHQQVVEGLGYVPGVCWSFLRVFLLIPLNDRKISRSLFPWNQKNTYLFFFSGLVSPQLDLLVGPPPNIPSLTEALPVPSWLPWRRRSRWLSFDLCLGGGGRDRTVKFGKVPKKQKRGGCEKQPPVLPMDASIWLVWFTYTFF